ncbi:MAG: purine-binding chemotaxis protein CheW [candidate division NC10 bacterium]|nr:purine-binding chemotaxis protein CheW [candidate division NC10 bacterium]
MSASVLEQTQAVRACLFQLAGESFAVEVRWAREVVVFEDYTVVPKAPAHVVGVANLRGSIIPILDVRAILGLPGYQKVGRGSTALVISEGGVQAALAIEGILGLESFDEVVPFGEAGRKEFGEFGVGLLRRGEGLVTLLDVPKLLEALRIGAGQTVAVRGGEA